MRIEERGAEDRRGVGLVAALGVLGKDERSGARSRGARGIGRSRRPHQSAPAPLSAQVSRTKSAGASVSARAVGAMPAAA